MPRTTQLQTYTIQEDLLEERAGRWRELVVLLRLGPESVPASLPRQRCRSVRPRSRESPGTPER